MWRVYASSRLILVALCLCRVVFTSPCFELFLPSLAFSLFVFRSFVLFSLLLASSRPLHHTVNAHTCVRTRAHTHTHALLGAAWAWCRSGSPLFHKSLSLVPVSSFVPVSIHRSPAFCGCVVSAMLLLSAATVIHFTFT